MNILFITIAWPKSGERNLYTDLMDEFVLQKHNVYVIGTQYDELPSDNEIKDENGIKVLRINSGKIRKTSHLRKLFSLLTLGNKMLRGIEKHFPDIVFNLIISPTPPITLSTLYKKLKHKYNARFYLLLKDIWPQGSVDHGVFSRYSIPWLFFRQHEIRTYKTADYIGCMSPLGAEYILSKNTYIARNKVEVCPNCIQLNNNIDENGGEKIRAKYGIPADACVFIFSGNLGIGHGLGFLVEAIKQLADYPKAFFVIGGSGTHFRFLEDKLKEFPHKNVFLYNWLPSDDFNQILAACDVGLILLYKYTVPQFPSRLLSYMEYSKPILCAVNQYTDIGTIVENHGCGCSTIHGNINEFISAIKYFSENKSERQRMGKNARKLLIDNYTVVHGYKIIMNHFKNQYIH
ncbi:MAG: glycosyltransferase family 4 protein [Bacteroidales bacterium]|nr:glycosyltransferase family 4 protein [Bacteroidales bacterium]